LVSASPSQSASGSPSASPSASVSASESASPSASASESEEPVFSVRLSARQGHGYRGHGQWHGVHRPAQSTLTHSGSQT
jgi:hypothetical protein